MYLSVDTSPFISTSAPPGGDKRHGELHAAHIAFLFDDGKSRRIYIVFFADTQYFGLVAEYGRLYETLTPGFVYSTEGMGIVTVGNGQTFTATETGLFHKFFKLRYHMVL